jgi:hypothetical protein
MKKLHKIENGVITNTAIFDPDNLPDWADTWVEIPEASVGWRLVGGVWEPPAGPTPEELAVYIREKRNQLLTASDWTQMPDAPVDQAAWATYRQALRDIPQQAGFPTDITWPTKPE